MKQPRQKRVLYVEDEIRLQEYMRTVFKSFISNCTLVTAKNGQDALDKLKKESFDLILSDVIMPKMDGNEFYGELQKSEQKHIPFCFITGYVDKIDPNITDSVKIINKPVSLDELIEYIEKNC